MGTHRKPAKCAICRGKGYIEVGKNGHTEKRTCSKCNGTGVIR